MPELRKGAPLTHQRLVRLTYNGDGVVEVARGSKAEAVLRRAGWREA